MYRIKHLENFRGRQTGMLTVFTAVLVLIVLTLMIFYASRSGLFEQRVSANEVRQKQAFHAAEAALDQAAEYLLANQKLILSNAVAAYPDGSGGLRNGWRQDGKWTECTDDLRSNPDHPCGGTPPMPVGSFFYNDVDTGFELMTIEVPGAAEGVTARVTANVCKVDLGNPGVCVGLDTGTPGGTFMVITLMGYGFSDCLDVTDVTTCQGRAAVAKPLGNFKALAGAPTVPLVTRTVFPPNGTAIVVPNPNGGGVGVPISAWVNDNDSLTPADPVTGGTCTQDADAVLSSGTWNTCELQEWYDREAVPAGVACDQPPGQCSCTEAESISYKKTGQNTVLGIDIVKDKAFPCDLFHTFFNVRDTQYASVKNTMPQQLDAGDCDTLDASSSGLIWISGVGDTCNLNNATIGTKDNPVVIVSAASETKLSGSVTIFGVLFVFDGEDVAAEFSGAGTGTIYGALIVDADMQKFTGTVNVVYSDGVLLEASDLGGFGEINGGWRDFGLPTVSW